MTLRKRAWSDTDLKRLSEIVAAGGSPFRAAAALKRRIISCQIQANKMGTPFKKVLAVRKEIKVKLAVEQELVRR